MISIVDLILESERKRVEGLVRITYAESASTMDIAEILRAIEDVTIVNTAGTEEGDNVATYTIKFYTPLKPKQAFVRLRQQALAFSEIKKLEIATKSIETF